MHTTCTLDSINLDAIIAHAKAYGFVFQSSEIYGGLAAVYDYGPMGVALKNNLKTYWWKSMVQMHQNIVGIDAAILMSPKVWKASGHVNNFSDPMIDNKDSKKRYRADHLLESKIETYAESGSKEDAHRLQKDMDDLLAANNLAGLKDLIIAEKIVCPVSKTSNWTDVRQFNLMFSTEIGAIETEQDKVYLRPETAQGIFVNFLNVQKTQRLKIPFGIAQIGKAFRNELIARQFIMRMREFEQMEMQFFVEPGTEGVWYEHWKDARWDWHLALGVPAAKYQYQNHAKLAHYANAATDIEFKFPFGFKEVEGIHSRTDFDLKQHTEHSKKKLTYLDTDTNEHYTPYVIETSLGLDRMFLLTLCAAFAEENLGTPEKEDLRPFLKLHPALAPVKLAILPLCKKDGLPEIAQQILSDLCLDFDVQYDETGSIGKRYRRQDAIGTPFCATIDHQTLADNTVTIRRRDSMQQERMPIAKLKSFIAEEVSWANLLQAASPAEVK